MPAILSSGRITAAPDMSARRTERADDFALVESVRRRARDLFRDAAIAAE